MYIAYFDESGDDGLPGSSPLFVLSCVYMHHQYWKENFQRIHDFRRQLAKERSFPFHLEMHTKGFLLDKCPYRELGREPSFRKEILALWCSLIGSVNCRIVNVVINKTVVKRRDYGVLENAFTYAIQRIENDLSREGNRFLIITDEGRVGKMRNTARRIQRFNPIPSKYGPDSYRKEIELLVEDPLPKSSRESHFIQMADLVAYLVRLRVGIETGVQALPNRLQPVLDEGDLEDMFMALKPSLNLKASGGHPWGFVCYPKS
jgi:hypothetical protein